MNKAETQRELRKKSEASFKSRGFRFVGAREAYTRKFRLGEQRYFLRLVSSGSDWLVEPSVAVRFKEVEDIFHRTSGVPKSMQSDSATLWIGMEGLSGLPREECVPRISGIADVMKAVGTVEDLFAEHGESYLSEHQALEDVDRVLNLNPNEPTLHCAPPRRSGYGVIVAMLLNRGDFEALAKDHRNRVALIDRGFHLDWFDLLLNDLRKFRE